MRCTGRAKEEIKDNAREKETGGTGGTGKARAVAREERQDNMQMGSVVGAGSGGILPGIAKQRTRTWTQSGQKEKGNEEKTGSML